MKQWIKNFIKKIPGIRGFVGKWFKARVDIETLQKQDAQQGKVNARQSRINEHQKKLNYRQKKINDKRKLQIATLQKKVKLLNKNSVEPRVIYESSLKGDLAYIKMLHLERNLAFEKP